MKLFLFDSELDKEVNQIIKMVQLRKHGEVAELIDTPGNRYKMSYGVSLNQLIQIAEKYLNNNRLAEQLWFKEIRETMLLATMICNPDEFTTEQFKEWIELVHALELAEHLSKNLVSNTSHLEQMIDVALDQPDEAQNSTGWFSAGWALRRENLVAGELTQRMISKNNPEGLIQYPFQARAVSFMLRQLIRSSTEGKKQAEEWSETYRFSNNYYVKMILEEVKTELIWGNNH